MRVDGKEGTMEVQDVIAQARGALRVKRVFGEPSRGTAFAFLVWRDCLRAFAGGLLSALASAPVLGGHVAYPPTRFSRLI